MKSSNRTEKSALLVIDMQLVAFDGLIAEPVTNGIALLNTVAALIAACRQNRIPIVFVQTCARAGQRYSRQAHGWEIHPDLKPLQDDIIVFKTGSSGFDRTELKTRLDAQGIDQLLVCGIWSQHCVAKTCKDAMALGYATILIGDAHGTVANTDDNAADIVAAQNSFLNDLGVKVVESQQWLYGK